MKYTEMQNILRPLADEYYLTIDKYAREIIEKVISEICDKYNEMVIDKKIVENKTDFNDNFVNIAQDKFNEINNKIICEFKKIINEI